MARPQPGGFDGLGDFVDLSQYDNNSDLAYQPPSLSPSTTSNLSPSLSLEAESSSETSSLFPTNQGFTGPSHQYDLYKQQTGLVPGALTTTLSMNQPQGYFQEYLDFQQHNFGEDAFDFNQPLEGLMESSLDMDFQTSPTDGMYLNSTINPNVIGGQEPDALPSPMTTPTMPGNLPFVGMHQQQAAMARAQQQKLQQRQRQQALAQQQAKQAQKARSPQTSDSIAEQSVQQILSSMRAEPVQYTPVKTSPAVNFPKKPKTESEMDEDEKFLASEEGKKLDSRERRQLRNKVSARAFRGRRKGKTISQHNQSPIRNANVVTTEYIVWLESQLTDKTNEAGLLRAHNRALVEENARLSSLTKMLLSSPQFKDMLSDLSSNPQKLAQLATAQQPQRQQQPQQHVQLPHGMSAQQRSQHFQEQFQEHYQHQACYAA